MLAHRSSCRYRRSRSGKAGDAISEHHAHTGKGFAAFLQAQMSSKPPEDLFIRTFRASFNPPTQSRRFATMDKLSETEAIVEPICHIKSEFEPDTPWQGLASIPAMLPTDLDHYDSEASIFTDRLGALDGDSTFRTRQVDNLSPSFYQPVYGYAHRTAAAAQQLPTFNDMHFDTLAATLPSAWQNLDEYNNVPHLATMDPQAVWLSPQQVNHLDSDAFTTVRTDVAANEFETVSDWSRVSADFEDLAASSPESEYTQYEETGTPASSISQPATDLWNEDVSRKPQTTYHSGSLPNVARWRSIDGNVTSVMALPVRQPAAPYVPVAESAISTGSGDQASAPISAPCIPVEMSERSKQDEYLLAMRKLGTSYKEIKRRGKFREAESTLRGRVRVLTKAKEDRVRKPVWTRSDLKLLHAAVRRHYVHAAYDRPSNCGKLPWKRISEWLSANGSSYDFASATCARKWEEIKD